MLTRVLALTLVALLSLPTRAADAPKPLVITEADAGKTLDAKVGQVIDVVLVGDQPRTGWEAGALQGPVQRVGHQKGDRGAVASPDFAPKEGAADKAVGTYTFHYAAVAPGKVEMRFTYIFPGGPVPTARDASKRVKELRVTVNVIEGK
ncbi:MAG TPA: protease inhibitor I42 family protein [Tepidisphaeraceae bacterium]|nr:protease inhibitor I42 family protein [Tepidisphaeraceae bacterium]